MKYLLDTGIFLWSLGPLVRLNEQAQQLLADGKQELYLSAASVWEISIKSMLGKLQLPEPPARLVPSSVKFYGIHPLHITYFHALALTELPAYHHDPFDRMLVAQARSENMVLMTADKMLSRYPVEVLWCGK